MAGGVRPHAARHALRGAAHSLLEQKQTARARQAPNQYKKFDTNWRASFQLLLWTFFSAFLVRPWKDVVCIKTQNLESKTTSKNMHTYERTHCPEARLSLPFRCCCWRDVAVRVLARGRAHERVWCKCGLCVSMYVRVYMCVMRAWQCEWRVGVPVTNE
jgi:hypothetical protein